MKVIQSPANFSHSSNCFFLRQSFFSLDHLVQSSFLHVFHHDIDVCRVMEEAVHLNYVWVVEEETNLQLLCELLQH